MDVCGAASAIRTPSVQVKQALHRWVIFFSAERWSLLCRLGSAASGLISATRMVYCFCRNLTLHLSVSAKGDQGCSWYRFSDHNNSSFAADGVLASSSPSEDDGDQVTVGICGVSGDFNAGDHFCGG